MPQHYGKRRLRQPPRARRMGRGPRLDKIQSLRERLAQRIQTIQGQRGVLGAGQSPPFNPNSPPEFIPRASGMSPPFNPNSPPELIPRAGDSSRVLYPQGESPPFNPNMPFPGGRLPGPRGPRGPFPTVDGPLSVQDIMRQLKQLVPERGLGGRGRQNFGMIRRQVRGMGGADPRFLQQMLGIGEAAGNNPFGAILTKQFGIGPNERGNMGRGPEELARFQVLARNPGLGRMQQMPFRQLMFQRALRNF